MAIEPPAAPTPTAPSTPATAATPPKGGGCFGRGCGCSCLGCVGVLALAGLLLLGSGYWFFVAQASAAVTAPATLIVFNQPVTVNSNPGIPGEALNAGDEVATQAAGQRLASSDTVRMIPQPMQTKFHGMCSGGL